MHLLLANLGYAEHNASVLALITSKVVHQRPVTHGAVMADKGLIPAERALAELRDRIAADSTIDASVKIAILVDMSSASPAHLEHLRRLFAALGGTQ